MVTPPSGSSRSLVHVRRTALGASLGLALFVALALPAPASAQGRFSVGVHGSYATELVGGTPGVGGRVSVGLAPLLRRVRLQATGDVFFPDCVGGGDSECSYWETNFNAILSNSADPDVGGMYLGAGVNVQHFEDPSNPEGPVDDTGVGLNAILGFALDARGPIQPLAEFRYELFAPDGIQQIVFTVGVRL